ncbi:unnamed protein product [Thlaspi arvense]|uniref:Uncharacterized protein n=1 Tax=Thlaspi arvense TaxID=13288 RepID=A0AAU9R499_THLAR|nr:unnamed protein product [Thlaspi arvense]
MALSKFQLATFLLITCSLLFTIQSKILKTEQIGDEECVYRGRCLFSDECKSRCGPPEFPRGTLGLCMVSPVGSEFLCCCVSQ